MRHPAIGLAVLLSAALFVQAPAFADLTTDQKVLDFQSLASIYAKRYAPYDWKRTLFQYDALDLAPWLDQVRASNSDLEYLDILVRYVAALNDTHSTYRLPTNFGARLGFTLDACWSDDGKTLYACITSIDRSVLPSSRYPFVVGDVVVSVDGTKVADYADRMYPYVSAASWDSGLRKAMDLITTRAQAQYPLLPLIKSSIQVVIQQQTGGQQTYTLPWLASGTPLLKLGGIPSFTSTERPATRSAGFSADDPLPPYLEAIARYWNASDTPEAAIVGYGQTTPIWALPQGFTTRLGRGVSDEFFSGTFTVRGHTVGYLRLGSFSPTSASGALQQLDKEIQFFQDNTEGLVVDVMHNTGGQVCYSEDVMSRLMTDTWRPTPFQLKPIWSDISSMASSVSLAKALNAPQETIDLLQARYDDLKRAYNDGSALTEAVPVCQTSPERAPNKINYTKPILLLTDEFSTSSADLFASTFSDSGRGRTFGYRTNGAGGTVLDYSAAFYAEGTTRVVSSLMYRKDAHDTDGYPSTHYIENIGVAPNLWFDYTNLNNVRKNGSLFVSAFQNAIADLIEGK